jgi:hypothetical protein
MSALPLGKYALALKKPKHHGVVRMLGDAPVR